MKSFLSLILSGLLLICSGQPSGLVITPGSPAILITAGAPGIAIGSRSVVNNSIYYVNLKPDLEGLSNITINGNQATANRSFLPNDVGKCFVVFRGRSYPAYSSEPVTLNAVINAVNAGTATLASYDLDDAGNALGTITNGTSLTGFVATDNWQKYQDALDSASAKGLSTLIVNHVGTAYMVPGRHTGALFGTRRYANKINSNITVRGLGAGITKLKYGREDIQQVDHSTEADYSAYYIGNVSFKSVGITYISADRTSTEVDNQNVQVVYAKPLASNETSYQSISFDSCNILSGNGNFWEGWGGSIYMNNSAPVAPGGVEVVEFKNGVLEAQSGPAHFNQETGNPAIDNGNRTLRLINAEVKAGAEYVRQIPNVKVVKGSDIVELPAGYSWYDFINYIDFGSNNRNVVFTLVNQAVPYSYPYNGPTLYNNLYDTGSNVLTTANALFAIVDQVIDPTHARIRVNGQNSKKYIDGSAGAPNATWQAPEFSSTTCNLFTSDNGQFRFAVFHGAYRSGNVGIILRNVKAHVLRYILNTQHPREPFYEGEVTNTDCIKDIIYQAAEKLRWLVGGSGYGVNAQECGIL